MISLDSLSSLTQKILDIVPKGLTELPADLRSNVRALIESELHKLDLVPRGEFDAQVKVLKRTRKKLDDLINQTSKENT